MVRSVEKIASLLSLGMIGLSFLKPEPAFAQSPDPTTTPPYEVTIPHDNAWTVSELNAEVMVRTFCKNDSDNPDPEKKEWIKIMLRRLNFEAGEEVSLEILREIDIQIEAPRELQKRHAQAQRSILTLGSDPKKEDGILVSKEFNHGPAFTLTLLIRRGSQTLNSFESYFSCPGPRPRQTF